MAPSLASPSHRTAAMCAASGRGPGTYCEAPRGGRAESKRECLRPRSAAGSTAGFAALEETRERGGDGAEMAGGRSVSLAARLTEKLVRQLRRGGVSAAISVESTILPYT